VIISLVNLPPFINFRVALQGKEKNQERLSGGMEAAGKKTDMQAAADVGAAPMGDSTGVYRRPTRARSPACTCNETHLHPNIHTYSIHPRAQVTHEYSHIYTPMYTPACAARVAEVGHIVKEERSKGACS